MSSHAIDRVPSAPGRAAHRLRNDRGAALMEFALLLPLLAILAFGVADLGRAYSLQNRVTNMAREGAFYAQFHPYDVAGCPNGSTTDAARIEDPSLSSVTVTVTDATTGVAVPTSCGAAPVPGTRIRVRVTTTLKLITPMVGAVVGDPVTVGSSTEVVVQG
ncbi:MAG: TadE/TadG family type IV pilus assembly protein [Acidimicrobiales bacterium]